MSMLSLHTLKNDGVKPYVSLQDGSVVLTQEENMLGWLWVNVELENKNLL
jgi:hypothetical protein